MKLWNLTKSYVLVSFILADIYPSNLSESYFIGKKSGNYKKYLQVYFFRITLKVL